MPSPARERTRDTSREAEDRAAFAQDAGDVGGRERGHRVVDQTAVAALDPVRRDDVYWAGRVTLCAGPEDLRRYDAVFAALAAGQLLQLRPRPVTVVRSVPVASTGPDADEAGADGGDVDALLRAAASTVEVLRHKDVTTLESAERDAMRRALAALELPGEPRRSRRWRLLHCSRLMMRGSGSLL